MKLTFVLSICIHLVIYSAAIEPITTGIAVGTAIGLSAILAGYDTVVCTFKECCDHNWINPNFTLLSESFEKELHGQHLVRDVVVRTLRGHLNDKDPKKALVLSFHGWTGGGKNFVSRIIANALYRQGLDSTFVHLFVAPLHFPHESHVDNYKDQLRSWIAGNVTTCGRSLFIFDEMDKMPAGLLDAIKPFLEHYKDINGVDYRKTSFIFLSNTAGTAINDMTLKHWESGKERGELRYRDMEELIIKHAFNEKGGLWHSSLIQQNLVSAFVPFLPLERRHVRQCIVDELYRKGHRVTEVKVNQVADELHYFPPDLKLFSKSGCKKVSEKVDLLFEEV